MGLQGIPHGTTLRTRGPVAHRHAGWKDVPHRTPVTADVGHDYWRHIIGAVGWRNIQMDAESSEKLRIEN